MVMFMKIMKKIFPIMVIVLLSIMLVFAHEGEDDLEEINGGKELVENQVPCDQLNEDQFEAIGEYLMEQMHPGEQHEEMHRMMGMDTNEELHDQMHVNMAKMMYCSINQTGMMMPMNMMRMMKGSGGMMGGGMMKMMSGGNNGMMSTSYGMDTPGYGMMGWGWTMWLWNAVWFLFWIGVVVLVGWLIYKYIIKGARASPIETLKQRYACGELTKKQFEEMKQELW